MTIIKLDATVQSVSATQDFHGITIPCWAIVPTPEWMNWKYQSHPEGNHGPFLFQGFVNINGLPIGPLWMEMDKFSSTRPSQSCPNRDCRWWWIYPRNSKHFLELFTHHTPLIKNIESITVFVESF